MGVIFGLDIGVASVGIAVVDENYNVLEAVSDIFPEADATKNADRRNFRGTKRLIRRRQNRIKDFKSLWGYKSNLEIPNYDCNNQLELKVKSLNEEISQDELYFVLLNSLKHRGISYLDDALDEENAKTDYAKAVAFNEHELENKYPCQIQLERLEKYGKYRGDNKFRTEGEEDTVTSNVFTTASYRKEVIAILDQQKKHHAFLTDGFIELYLAIFDRKRKYYEGPGTERERTDYGIYTTRIDENGDFITEKNIFEKLIGRCSVYPDELRAAAASYTAQEFNVLNDLNNITVLGKHLTEEEKIEIINQIKTEKTVNVTKFIAAATGEKKESIKGFRIDKNDKPLYHKFEQYNSLRKELEKNELDINAFTREELDEIASILTLNTEREGILKGIETSSILSLDDNMVNLLVAYRKNHSSDFSKWHSFSLKIMNELIPTMYEEPKEQMQLLTEMGFFKKNNQKFAEYSSIPSKLVTEDIYNPVVKKSVRITIDAVNALIKKYGYPDKIVVEMPRDNNSDEEKKRITKAQKNNENEIVNIKKMLKESYNIELTDADYRNNKELNLKLKLWNEQNGICPYCGKHIDIYDLIYHNNGNSLYEIDHIIPKSISFDDSRSNKTLVHRSENKIKDNRTPFMYLSKLDQNAYDFNDYMNNVLNFNINNAKKNKYLFTEDITKVEVLKGFIERNINDTRYASRVVLNTLQGYFKEKQTETKIKVVRGSFTHEMRTALKLDKNREESYAHHAVDAMLLCYSQMGYDAYRHFQEGFIDFENNAVLDEEKMRYLNDTEYERYMVNDVVPTGSNYEAKWRIIKKKILSAEKNVKYWHKVDKKANRSLSDQTIWGTREINGEVHKINKVNIINDFKRFKGILDKKNGAERFLMYHNDSKTWEDLMTIMNQYADNDNPFKAYEEETGDYIRKHSKKHNGPRIQILKYEDGIVNSCIDISHKYGHEEGSKKVIMDSLKPYRTDVYYNEQENAYWLIGVKYSDCKFSGSKVCINPEKYLQALINEKLLQPGQTMDDLASTGYTFKFSLYKNDIIEYEKDGKFYMERFLSRTMPANKNYIETKPINAANFEKRNPVGLGKTTQIKKFRCDILGNLYLCQEEIFSLEVDIK